MCPHCGQNAPIVYRGVTAFCSACGNRRPALVGPSVSYTGKPSKVGGTVAGVAGWVVLIVGICITVGMSLLLSLLSSTVALAFGIPLGILTLAVSITLILSGRKLKQTGTVKEKEVRKNAVFALAANRRGRLTAAEASLALDMPPAQADAFLTDLARTEPEEVTLELDDRGGIYYAFPRVELANPQMPRQRSRIEGQPRVRVTGVPDSFEAEGVDYEEPAEQKRQQKRQGP